MATNLDASEESIYQLIMPNTWLKDTKCLNSCLMQVVNERRKSFKNESKQSILYVTYISAIFPQTHVLTKMYDFVLWNAKIKLNIFNSIFILVP